MLKHDDELLTVDAPKCIVDVALLRKPSLTIVLHAGNDHKVGVTTNDAMGVVEHLPLHVHLMADGRLFVPCCQIGIQLLIERIVMIAHDRKDSVGSLERAQQGHEGLYLAGILVLNVAREGYHVCLLSVDAIDHFF